MSDPVVKRIGTAAIVSEIVNRLEALQWVPKTIAAGPGIVGSDGLAYYNNLVPGQAYQWRPGNATQIESGGALLNDAGVFTPDYNTAQITGPANADFTGSLTLAQPPESVFERVVVFDSEDLVAAFRFLLVSEQRVAVVVPLDEEFKPALQGVKLVITRRLPVAVLVVDQVIGDRTAAFLGSTDPAIATPGALALAEYVLPALTGMLLGPENKVVSKPLHAGPLVIQDPKNETGGSRLAVHVDLECTGGRIEAVVGMAPEF